MDKKQLDKIIECFNKIIEVEKDEIYLYRIEKIEEIYSIIGKVPPVDAKDKSLEKFIMDCSKELVIEIKGKLNTDEERYFLKRLPEFAKISILDDTEKIKLLDKASPNDSFLIIESLENDAKKEEAIEKVKSEEEKSYVISIMKNDDRKIELLDTLKTEELKIDVILSMQDDDKKIKAMDKLESELYKSYVILSIKDEEKIIKALAKIEDELVRTKIISLLENDERKINLLDKIEIEWNKTTIIESLKDDKIKLAQLDKVNDDIYRLKIILSLKNEENKILAIDKLEDEACKASVISKLKDDNIKIELLKKIQDESVKAGIISSFNSDDKKIELLNEIKDEYWKIYIITSLKKDEDKVKTLFDIKEEINRKTIILSLKSDDKKIKMLPEIKKEEDKAEVISSLEDDSKKIKELGKILEKVNKIEVILSINDETRKLNLLEEMDSDICEAYKQLIELNLGFEDLELQKERKKYDSFNLPKEMSIGIEIESEGTYKNILPNFIGKWQVKDDISLDEDGKECTSPIMHDEYKDIYEIYKITEILKKIGMHATQRCGGHVHIGADYIKTEEGFKELLELWGNAEEVYYLISNKQGELPRKGIERYAAPISTKIQKAKLDKKEKDVFLEDAKRMQHDRYSAINLMNVNNEKNTIEFRLSNGTLDGNTWIENIRLYGRTVQIAQELGQIKEKIDKGIPINEEEKRKYALKEMLKDERPIDEKMEILMEILFTEEEAQVYRRRYGKNKRLEEKEHSMQEFEFGEVDFEKVYESVEIPQGIVDEIREGREGIEQR